MLIFVHWINDVIRLLQRFDGGHTLPEVLGMIQYETKKKSDGMNLCLMGFAATRGLNPEFKDIKMTGEEKWTAEDGDCLKYNSALYGQRPVTKEISEGDKVFHVDGGGKRHQGECCELFDQDNATFYPQDKKGNRENVLFGPLQLEDDRALIYFLTVVATYFSGDEDNLGRFDKDTACIGQGLHGVVQKTGSVHLIRFFNSGFLILGAILIYIYIYANMHCSLLMAPHNCHFEVLLGKHGKESTTKTDLTIRRASTKASRLATQKTQYGTPW